MVSEEENQAGKQLAQKAAAWDYVLNQWKQNQFPNLKRFLTGTVVEYREITDASAFDEQCNDELLTQYRDASRFAGCFYITADEHFHIRVFFDRDVRPGLWSILTDARLGLLRLGK